jgi:hypothetical protein
MVDFTPKKWGIVEFKNMEKQEENVIGKIAVTILGTAGMFAFIYMICSFYVSSFDIANWSADTRLFCASIGGFLSLFIGVTIWIGLRKY